MLAEQYERQNLEKILIGTLYDEEELERKTNQYNQIARDDKGHKRFHGAFTGGFQAGYNNTVGSKDGWVPSQFYSSQTQRGQIKQQSVLDFMDEEDLGESIAGKDLLAQNQFNTVGMKSTNENATTILQQIQNELLIAQPDSFGEQILNNMKKEKRKEELNEIIENQIGLIQASNMYGPAFEQLDKERKHMNEEENKLYDPLLFQKENVSFKNNYYGLGYDETFQQPQDEEEAFEKEFFTLIKKQNNFDETLDENEQKQKKKIHWNNIFGNNANAYEKDDIIQFEDGQLIQNSKQEKEKEKETSQNFKVYFQDILKEQQAPQAFTLKEMFGDPKDRLKIAIHGKNLTVPDNYTPSFHSKVQSQQYFTTQKLTHKDREQLLEGQQPDPIQSIEEKQQQINSKFLKDFLRGERTFIQSGTENSEKPAATSEGNLLGMRMRTVVQWVPNGLLCRRFNVSQPNNESTGDKRVKQNQMVPPMFLGNKEKFFMFQQDIEKDIQYQQQMKKEYIQSRFEAKEIINLNEQNKIENESEEEKEIEKEEEKEEEQIAEIKQKPLEPEIKQKRDLFESIFGDDDDE